MKKKLAVITGGTRGIGKATAIAFAIEGYHVVVCGKNRKNLEKAGHEIKALTDDVTLIRCNLTKPTEIKFFADQIKDLGKIDVLVNNAGVAYYKDFKKMIQREINETIDVNIRGLILTTKYLLPLMTKDCIIINVSSGAGKVGFAGLAVYCASKFAVIGFTQSLADEMKEKKMIALCPGGVDTDMYQDAFGEKPSLKPEHIAAKILEICENPKKFPSGKSVDVYHVTDALNYLKLKYFKDYKNKG